VNFLLYRTRSVWRFRLIVGLIIGLIFFSFNPWIIQQTIDSYVGYSGRVVSKGLFVWPLGLSQTVSDNGWHYYMIIEDSDGQRHKHYIDSFEYSKCATGIMATKQKGFSKPVTFAGQMTSKELSELAQKAGVELPSHPPWGWFLVIGGVFYIFRRIFNWAKSDE